MFFHNDSARSARKKAVIVRQTNGLFDDNGLVYHSIMPFPPHNDVPQHVPE